VAVDRPSSLGAKLLAILGLVLSLPVLGFAWTLALLALSQGIPSDTSQFSMGLARDMTFWGLAAAPLGTLGLAAGVGEWLGGRRRLATWLLWSPVLLVVLTLVGLKGYMLYVQASGRHG
jgi:hypothetical protein